jgi:DNA replication protein DnaC
MQAASETAIKWLESKGAEIKKIGICGGCGAPMFKTKIIINGEVIESAPPCTPCEDYENQLKSKENAKRDERLKRQAAFNQNSLMNDLLKECTFDTYKADHPTQKDARKLALEFYKEQLKPKAEKNPDFKNVLLYGNVGRGKSHLAAATAKALNEAGIDTLFITTGLLFRKLKGTFNKTSEHSEDTLMNMLEEVEVLFLDDIGAQNATDWKDETMLNLLDKRQGKATFYTTNILPENMPEVVGDRSWERIIHKTAGLEVQGENRRAAFKDWRSIIAN